MTPYIPVADAARLAARSHRTIRAWVRRGDVRARTEHGALLVAWADVLVMNDTTGRRVRYPKARRCG